MRIRSGAEGEPQSVLLTHDGQTAKAGRCGETLSLNPDAIGYYRVRYDAPSFKANLANFNRLRNGDRIALLDDQWALVQSGTENLGSFLSLAAAMGADLDARIWQQIADALATIEFDERGSAGHDAFAALARSMIEPVASRMGWDARPDETPDLQQLRRALIKNLGLWGDQAVIGEARKRFTAFVADHRAIAPDDQSMILSIVARYADVSSFDQLHSIAKRAADETEQRRYFSALMDVGDPQLAKQAAAIALSDEIPPQGARWRMALIVRLAELHKELSWSTFTENAEMLLAPMPKYAPLIKAQYVPEISGIVRRSIRSRRGCVRTCLRRCRTTSRAAWRLRDSNAQRKTCSCLQRMPMSALPHRRGEAARIRPPG